MEEIKIENTIESTIKTVDVLKEVTPESVAETKIPLVRGYRGRFVNGNRESVGNKGGRPRKLTFAELVENPEKLQRIIERSENGDTDALIILINLMEGKIK